MFQKYCLFLLLIILTGCQSSTDQLRIATAANLQYAMKALSSSFTQETGIPCEVILGSSGKLSAQIEAGAPYDLFFSADLYYPNYLYQKGLSLSKPIPYAKGQLVLWTTKEGLMPSLALLGEATIRYIALPNPALAPYGKAAQEILRKQANYEMLQQKCVFGENVAQTNQFITSQAAEIGFTAKAVVISEQWRAKGKWMSLDSNEYQALNQGAVILKNRTKFTENAKAFLKFVQSSQGQQLLEEYGYESIQ